jgi:hypothetical protein
MLSEVNIFGAHINTLIHSPVLLNQALIFTKKESLGLEIVGGCPLSPEDGCKKNNIQIL